jgi:hypothetical protein
MSRTKGPVIPTLAGHRWKRPGWSGVSLNVPAHWEVRAIGTFRLQLGKTDSFALVLMDGKRSLGDLGGVVSRKYRRHRCAREIAVSAFPRELVRRDLIGFRLPRDEGEKTARGKQEA